MTEAELKLLIDPSDAEKLARHPLLVQWASKRPYTRVLENRYLDTPDFQLANQGVALRLRRIGAHWRQTLKTGNLSLAGLHSRSEWEMPVAGPRLEWARLAAVLPPELPLVAELARADLRRRLAPRVLTRFKRRIWHLLTPAGDTLELAVDLGEISAGGKALPIAEIELELKAGDVAALYEVALALAIDLPLGLGSQGKAERGYALLSPRAFAAVGAQRIELDAAGGVGQALAAIVAGCLAQVEGNEAGLREANDPECLHQTRVGLRRLRAALKLFAPFAALPEAWQSDVRWAATALGPARDWHVFAEGSLARLPGTGPGGDLEALREAARLRSEAKQRDALASYDPARQARWRLALMAWALKQRQREGAETLVDWARGVLQHLTRRLNKRARDLRKASPEARHAARITAKQLRYALEFFGPILDAPAATAAAKALARLQDALGLINDAAVAQGLLRELATDHPELVPAAAWAQGWLAADSERLADKLASFWKPARKSLRKFLRSD